MKRAKCLKMGFLWLFYIVPAFSFAQNAVSLNMAIQSGISYLHEQLPRGTRIAILNVQGSTLELSNYMVQKLSAAFVNDKYFIMIERSAAVLNTLAQEMNYQLSGDVSDETALSIGKQLGTEVIISGSISRPLHRSETAYRLDLKAVQVESARIAGQWYAENIQPESTWTVFDQKRLTATIRLKDESARVIALKTAEILRMEGFLLTDSGGVYTVIINFEANESVTRNYHTVEPVLDIIIEAQDGTPMVTYRKRYPLFRHVTREEALQRAFRNIEQNLDGEFAGEVRELGK
ncbi:hypothetical protein LQZ19_18990 [Treponema primitia]|uniref:hypothetical protein n=1 Tax=Treponema primitia TaxID=88058 RepID=UPI00397F951A